jgi:hypothetical protein
MKYDQKAIIRFLYKERVSPEDIHAPLDAQFGYSFNWPFAFSSLSKPKPSTRRNGNGNYTLVPFPPLPSIPQLHNLFPLEYEKGQLF